MNPFAIPQLICSAAILTSGIAVLQKNLKSPINQSFFNLTLATFFWLFFYAVNFQFLKNSTYKDFIFKLAYCGVTFISVTFIHYTVEALELRKFRPYLLLNYCLGFLFSYLIFTTPLIVDGLLFFPWGYYPKAGTLHPYFLIYFLGSIVVGFYLIIKNFRQLKDRSGNKFLQMKLLLISLAIFACACIDFLPNYGINIYPVGFIFATLFLAITAYAIQKYRFMDLKFVIRKGLIYSILITIITLTYLIFILFIENISRGLLGYTDLAASLLSATIIAVIFIPLRTKIQKFVDTVFFKGTAEELARQNNLLIKEVAEKEKFKAVSTLASGMAHEIRNPLTAIKTFYEKFREKKNDSEFLNKFTNITGKEITRIEGLVQQLLDFSRPSELKLKDTNLNKLLQETIDLAHNKIEKNRIKTVLELDNKLPTNFKADPNRLKQAFLNLIINAIDAMPNSGTLTVSTRVKGSKDLGIKNQNPQSLKASNPAIEISIADTGPGIAKEDLPHIFEPFYSKKEKGTGLGLAITKGIIEEHRGLLNVTSKLNQGAKFLIYLSN